MVDCAREGDEFYGGSTVMQQSERENFRSLSAVSSDIFDFRHWPQDSNHCSSPSLADVSIEQGKES